MQRCLSSGLRRTRSKRSLPILQCLANLVMTHGVLDSSLPPGNFLFGNGVVLMQAACTRIDTDLFSSSPTVAPLRDGYGFPPFGGGTWLLASIFLTHWNFASVEDGWFDCQQSAQGTEWEALSSSPRSCNKRDVPSGRSSHGQCSV
eukprot:675508-Karenia_brevis.AAC.1